MDTHTINRIPLRLRLRHAQVLSAISAWIDRLNRRIDAVAFSSRHRMGSWEGSVSWCAGMLLRADEKGASPD